MDALKILIGRLDIPSDAMTLKMISFAILSLLGSDEGVEEFLQLKGLEKIIELARSQDATIRELALKSLETLSEEDKLKRPLYEHKCVDFMLEVVNSDSPIQQKHIAAKCLPHILTNDENMRDLFAGGHLEGFKTWLHHDDVTIRAYAALCISNLARSGITFSSSSSLFLLCLSPKLKLPYNSDENCVSMVKGGLASSIVSFLKRDDPKEKNGALAALRNLSLASQLFPFLFFYLFVSRAGDSISFVQITEENKTAMGQSGLIEELHELFKGDNLSLKFDGVVICKILATGNGRLRCFFVI
jgi:hypothetical protein